MTGTRVQHKPGSGRLVYSLSFSRCYTIQACYSKMCSLLLIQRAYCKSEDLNWT